MSFTSKLLFTLSLSAQTDPNHAASVRCQLPVARQAPERVQDAQHKRALGARVHPSILASSAHWKCDTSAVHVAAEHRLLRSCSGV